MQVFDAALTAAEVAGTDRARCARQLPRSTTSSPASTRRTIAVSRTSSTTCAWQENRLIADVPEIMVMEEMPAPRPAFVLKRGAYDAPGEVVPRDTPASLPPFPPDQPRNRLGLARWLTDRAQPADRPRRRQPHLAHDFGRGLVETPDNFGSQGRLPTHPELLDWLARPVRRRGGGT